MANSQNAAFDGKRKKCHHHMTGAMAYLVDLLSGDELD